MLTKTFRAQNMMLALKEVQTELGSDAMIISMREVPSGSIWAAWRKPGVEVIASKSTKNVDSSKKSESPEPILEKQQTEKYQPTTEDLKNEIENLKLVLSGQKLPLESKPSLIKETFANLNVNINAKDSYLGKTHFDINDFEILPETENKETKRFLEKAADILSKTELVDIKNQNKPELPANLKHIKQNLLDQGVNPDLIEKIINTNLDALSPSALEDVARLNRFIMHQLTVNLPPARKTLAVVPSRVMVLTGTSGSGKTSCCAKLASFYMLSMGKKVVWIEADTIKTSAIAEARTFTESLGIPLFLAYTPQELAELIASQTDADLILVDTASCNPRVEDNIIELGSFLSIVPSGSIYLVASATTKEQDLIQTEKAFKQFGLKGLILTKTDETGSFGASYDLVNQSKLPLYFTTSGIQILGNLKPGNPEQLVSALFEGEYPRE